MRTSFIAAVCIVLLAMPTFTFAQLQSQGIFDCNRTGAYAMSTGTFGATAGSFVPVYDNSVTLNTGYLTYKECVLRPAVDALRIAATTAYDNAELQQFLTGRTDVSGNSGQPYFVQNFWQEDNGVGDQTFNNSFYPVTNNLNPAFQQQLQVVIARNYAQQTNAPYASLSCPYSGNLTAVLNGTITGGSSDFWNGFGAMLEPSCSPLSAYTLAQNQLNYNVASAQYAWQTQLQWGNGYYGVTDSSGRVVTPGALVGLIAGQAVTSGQRQLESANDIGQMVGALFAGMSNRILNGSVGGLASVGTSIGTSPSYLAQVGQESQTGLNSAVTNVALSILGPALTFEQQYNQTISAIAALYSNAITQLKSYENTCWNLIETNVCSDTPVGTSCTGTSGARLTIATSTSGGPQFAQPLIDSQIRAPALQIAQLYQDSNRAITAINTLIASVQNTSSADIQITARNQLDQLVRQGVLHNQNTLNAAAEELTSKQQDVPAFVLSVQHQWAGDDTTNNVSGAIAWNGSSQSGWCNASTQTPGGPATLQLWLRQWGGATSTTP